MSDEVRLDRLCAFVASLPEPKRPPIVVPDESFLSAEQIFRHIDPRAVPEIAGALEYLMEHHPDVIAAIGDVDRTLIWDAMERTPLENLTRAEGLSSLDEEAMRATLREAAAKQVA